MKYELINTDISKELPVVINTIDNEIVTQTLDTENYYVTITLGIRPTDGIAPDFSKDLIVVSSNHSTGFEVDEQRKIEIENFINLINGN